MGFSNNLIISVWFWALNRECCILRTRWNKEVNLEVVLHTVVCFALNNMYHIKCCCSSCSCLVFLWLCVWRHPFSLDSLLPLYLPQSPLVLIAFTTNNFDRSLSQFDKLFHFAQFCRCHSIYVNFPLHPLNIHLYLSVVWSLTFYSSLNLNIY